VSKRWTIEIVIHSIQLGEMVKDQHGTTQQMTKMQQHHATALAVIQEQYETVVGQVTVEESLHNLQQEVTTTRGDVQTQWQQWEQAVEQVTTRVDQLDDQHSTTRGDFCSFPTGHLHGPPDGSPVADDTTDAGC
jgi:TolA-binding protein